MNKDNENKSNHLDEEELNGSTETIVSGDDNHFVSENDSENSSDCSNNESIGGGDSPNTFVQSEEVIDETVEDDNEESETLEEIIDEDYQNDYSNDNTFIEEVEITETSSENQSTSLENIPNHTDAENDSISVEETSLNNEQSQNKVNKKQLIIIVAVILIIGATFIMVKKPFAKNDTTKISSVSSASPEEEKAMKSILDRLTSYYEPDSNGTLVFKSNVNVDMNDLEKLEKDINNVKDENAKSEFLRLYRQLQEDIINQSANSSSIEELSSSSVVSYNVTFNKA